MQAHQNVGNTEESSTGVSFEPRLPVNHVLRKASGVCHPTALKDLLPDRWVAAHPEHRLEQREEESREAQARRRRKRAARRMAAAQ